jgi:hypothetical protein
MHGTHRDLDVRRAVLGTLLSAGAPVRVGELVDLLGPRFGADAGPKGVSDLLRHQVRMGRVRRVERGVYAIVPGAIPKTTAWRCVNWRREMVRSSHPAPAASDGP